jgi:uncharacterized protein involved in outer membrane biogenesis
VNRVSKAILILLATTGSIGGMLMVGANLYLQSPGTQARIQEELAKALKLPLKITSTAVSPWGSIRVHGISVPSEDSASPNSAPFLEARSLSAHYRYLPLIKKRLVISELRVEQPKVVWPQNAKGRWELPARSPVAKVAQENKPAVPKPSAPRLKVVLENVRLLDGAVEWIDAKGVRVAACEGVQIDGRFAAPARVDGQLSAARVTLRESVFLSDLRTPFELDSAQIKFPALETRWADGILKGQIQANPRGRGYPFTGGLRFDQINLGRFTTEAGWDPGQAAGLLNGQIELRGRMDQIQRLEGSGVCSLQEGQFRQLDFFQTLGQVLQIDELSTLKLKTARANFRLGEERVTVDELLLEALEVKLTAAGAVRFDGKLGLDARLSIQEGLVKKMPGFLRDSFTVPEPPGLAFIDFKVSGRADRPRTDLAEKLVGKKLGDQFENLVSSLFGSKKKKDDDSKKKKKTPAAQPNQPPQEPAPAPSVVP